MKNKHFECNSCDAVFKLGHELDDNYYKIEYCPFCGEVLDEDDNFDIEEDYLD